MTADTHDWDASYLGAAPPWDIARAQPRFEALAETGALQGRILDIGCGTGEHALLAAAHGADAVGLDLSRRAIDVAREKATSRGLNVTFEVADALELATPAEPFDVIIDSGVFHVFDDTDRARYVAVLRRLLRTGGACYLMCFSDREPGDWGPRRVRAQELKESFADGWKLELAPATFDINPTNGLTEVQAWFATITRTH
jgi:cyclopropane fatty-acyl-phospholipid synthase-like methyltransferase